MKYLTELKSRKGVDASMSNNIRIEHGDQIYEAAQIVRSAHIKAGKILTALLKKKIVGVLSNYGDIDPFNIWEPMEMFIDNVGLVRILKIIDIGSPIFVDVADTNRLIEE